ncbi:MAG TPA: hypothetical protein VJO32_08580, partial [Ktedonobacteraceae bacterium]|nr:hypothetical protein [Ktedonobacteraceae bacterium]
PAKERIVNLLAFLSHVKQVYHRLLRIRGRGISIFEYVCANCFETLAIVLLAHYNELTTTYVSGRAI